jgi:hypothetical protein
MTEAKEGGKPVEQLNREEMIDHLINLGSKYPDHVHAKIEVAVARNELKQQKKKAKK